MTDFITNEAVTFEELENKFQEKVDCAQTCSDIRGGWGSDTIDEMKQYSQELNTIAAYIGNFKVALVQARCNIKTVKCVLKQIDHLSSKLNYMKSHLPPFLPCLMSDDKSCSELKNDKNEQNHSSLHVPIKDKEVETKRENQATSQKDHLKQPKPIPKVQYITVNEFEAVPKYTKGRIQYDQINQTIDQINSVLDSKYSLTRKPRSKLTPLEMSYVADFKKQLNTECKGLFFVVDNDIKRFSALKLDPACRNILTILRTLKKVKEIRGPGSLLRYCVNTY